MFFIYVLRSLKDGRLYTGSCENLERRLQQHYDGFCISTKHRRPLKFLYSEEFVTVSEARQRELFFKTGKGRDILKEILLSIDN